MTYDERTGALERFGYTPRQARFLTIAALHSGYFLSRQYVAFTRRRHGMAAVGFIRRTLERGHAAVIEAPMMARLYHLGSKPFYAALDEIDNRNRRVHSAASIRRRLMTLDYVIAHPDDTFLMTEREKVAYFVDEQQVSKSTLPAADFPSADGRSTTTRFFVEKLPIAVRPAGPVFAYIDDDETTDGGFATFLERHRALFSALNGSVHVVFVTTVPRHVTRAETCFSERLSGHDTRPRLDLTTLTAYVLARARVAQGLSGCPQQELDALRRDLAVLPGSTGDALYERWRMHGPTALDLWVREQQATTPRGDVTFSAVLLPHTYGLRPGVQSYHG
jgi:hypothetical protein